MLRHRIQGCGDYGHSICSRKAIKYSIVTISVSNIKQHRRIIGDTIFENLDSIFEIRESKFFKDPY